MRPCVACGHRSDPLVSRHCPECGEEQLPVGWSILYRESPTWIGWAAHAGSLFYIAMLVHWAISLWIGTSPPPVGVFTYLMIVCFPISVAHLRGKRLDDVWIIADNRLEHRPRVGKPTFHSVDDGWRVASVKPYGRSGHRWALRIERMVKGRRKGRADVLIDDRESDRAAVETAIRRALTPASASDTSAGAA